MPFSVFEYGLRQQENRFFLILGSMEQPTYIHGTSSAEQQRLKLLNRLTNPPFIRFLNPQPADRILELGSGVGILADEIARHLDSGKLTGVENSEEQLAQCPESYKQLEFIRGDVQRLPFEDDTFDKVYGRYILEHVSQPGKVVTEALRVLKPGGQVFFQENAILHLEFYPECLRFKSLWQKFVDLQSRIGGDAMIGIKMYSLLKSAGFRHLKLSVAPQNHHYDEEEFHMWVDNIIGNAESAKEELIRRGMVSPEEFHKAIRELEDLKRNELAAGYFCWNRITGIKSY